MEHKRKTAIFILILLLMVSGLTCNGDSDPASPPDEPFDPYKPEIEKFTASRGKDSVADNIVFSGEDIDLSVQAVSKAWPQSCGLDEGDVVKNNLIYTFSAIPPKGFDAPGLFSQATPPSNKATWRVPNVSGFDPGEGVIYTIKVMVFDQCLGSGNTGSITLRVFANQGPPLISSIKVESIIGSSPPTTETINKNGFYEVERGDRCRITVNALNRSYPSVCANRGIKDNEELLYSWETSHSSIELDYDEFPPRASKAEFNVPSVIPTGGKWSVTCTVTDACAGTEVKATFRFIVVAAPKITGIDCTVNGNIATENPYFDTYEVLPGDKVILIAYGVVMDDSLCDSKGIHPDLLWNWKETNKSTPSISPIYEPIPNPNDRSRFEFVVPAASNGTKYNFVCTLTDRCNELTDTGTANFTVIVPPSAVLTSVKRDSTNLSANIETGKYHVSPGDHMIIRISAASASSSSFCTTRGVSQNPPLYYDFILPWENVPVLNYNPMPSSDYCDLEFIIPSYTPPLDADLGCVVTDLCNELVAEIVIPFRVES